MTFTAPELRSRRTCGSDPPAHRRREAAVRRSAAVGAWCFLTVGVGHLAVMAGFWSQDRSPAQQHTIDAMHAVPVTLLGVARGDMATLYYGFSALMGLLSVAYGVVNLMVVRRSPELLTRSAALLWTNLCVAVAGLLIAVLAFPVPPIVLLAAATCAYAWALVRAGRRPA